LLLLLRKAKNTAWFYRNLLIWSIRFHRLQSFMYVACWSKWVKLISMKLS